MKWIFAIKEQLKVATALTVILTTILLINIVVKRNVAQMDHSIHSIYKDRLIPAGDISSILEKMYSNRLLLEQHIHTKNPVQYRELELTIGLQNRQTDSLIKQFSKTLLVEEEVAALESYQRNLPKYLATQTQIIQLSKYGDKAEAYTFYHQQGNQGFQQILQPIHLLSYIQTRVGKELYNSSKTNEATVQLLFSLETVITIIIGLIIYALLKASSMIFQKPQKFNLN